MNFKLMQTIWLRSTVKRFLGINHVTVWLKHQVLTILVRWKGLHYLYNQRYSNIKTKKKKNGRKIKMKNCKPRFPPPKNHSNFVNKWNACPLNLSFPFYNFSFTPSKALESFLRTGRRVSMDRWAPNKGRRVTKKNINFFFFYFTVIFVPEICSQRFLNFQFFPLKLLTEFPGIKKKKSWY